MEGAGVSLRVVYLGHIMEILGETLYVYYVCRGRIIVIRGLVVAPLSSYLP